MANVIFLKTDDGHLVSISNHLYKRYLVNQELAVKYVLGLMEYTDEITHC